MNHVIKCLSHQLRRAICFITADSAIVAVHCGQKIKRLFVAVSDHWNMQSECLTEVKG